MRLSPGDHLGAYEIIAPLGAGGMGEIYRARDTRLHRDVALKVLPESIADDPVRRARFEREAQAISRMNHPNICAAYDVGSHDGISYIVMEYIEGNRWRRTCAGDRFPQRRLWRGRSSRRNSRRLSSRQDCPTDDSGKYEFKGTLTDLALQCMTIRASRNGLQPRVSQACWRTAGTGSEREQVIWLDAGPAIVLDPGAYTVTIKFDIESAASRVSAAPCDGFSRRSRRAGFKRRCGPTPRPAMIIFDWSTWAAFQRC